MASLAAHNVLALDLVLEWMMSRGVKTPKHKQKARPVAGPRSLKLEDVEWTS